MKGGGITLRRSSFKGVGQGGVHEKRVLIGEVFDGTDGGEGAERVWHAGGKQFNCSLVVLNRFINRRSMPLAKWADSRQIDTSWLLKRVKAIVIKSSSRSKNAISLICVYFTLYCSMLRETERPISTRRCNLLLTV